jgi:hypothetical protein
MVDRVEFDVSAACPVHVRSGGTESEMAVVRFRDAVCLSVSDPPSGSSMVGLTQPTHQPERRQPDERCSP